MKEFIREVAEMVFKKQISISFITAMAMLGISISALSGTYVDDFNDGKPDGWEIVGGTWKIKDGGYHGNEPAETEGAILIGDDSWGPDYSVECKVRNVQGIWIAIFLRWMDINNHYDWWIDISNKRAHWYIKRGGYTQITADNIPLNLAKEFTLKAEINSFTCNGYFNGKLINTYTDNEKSFKTGVIGLCVWQAEATFDDVVIEGPNVPSNVKLLETKNKLTTTWGKVKLAY